MNTAEESSKSRCDSKQNWALHFKKLLVFLGWIEVLYCNIYKKCCGLFLVYEWLLFLTVYFLAVWYTINEFCDCFIPGILVHFSEVLNGLSVSHENKLRAKEWNINFWAQTFCLCAQIFRYISETGAGVCVCYFSFIGVQQIINFFSFQTFAFFGVLFNHWQPSFNVVLVLLVLGENPFITSFSLITATIKWQNKSDPQRL